MPQDFWVGVDSGTINAGTITRIGTVLGVGGTVSTSPSGTLATEQQFTPFNTGATGTTTIKSGAGFLHSLVINTRSTLGQAILYNSAGTSGTRIVTIDSTLSTTAFVYDVNFTNGLTLGNTGAGDVTISYR